MLWFEVTVKSCCFIKAGNRISSKTERVIKQAVTIRHTIRAAFRTRKERTVTSRQLSKQHPTQQLPVRESVCVCACTLSELIAVLQ